MTDAHDDRAGLAAEYALGTLDVDERTQAAALIEADPSFAALVAAWERRLGELHAMVDPVSPPPAVWVGLQARLAETIAATAAKTSPPPAPEPPVPGPSAPEPSAPEPPVSEPSAPELSAPEPSVPQPSVSEPSAPESSAPEPPAPEPHALDSSPPEPPDPVMDDLLAAVAASLAEPVEPIAPLSPARAHGVEESPTPGAEAAPIAVDRPEAEIAAVPVEPPSEPLAESRALVVRPPSPDDSFGGHAAVGSVTGHDAETVRGLVRSVQRWRSVAAGFAAFAAALTALTVTTALAPDLLPLPLRPPAQVVEVPREVVRTVEVPGTSPGRFVAVLQGNSARPAFLLTLDPDHKSMMVRRVAADDEGDKRYELWLVSDRLPAPHSLGLLGGAEFTTVPAIASFEPEIVDAAVYAVSLEASTGSPAAGPTGPVLFSGRLVESVPPMAASGSGTP